MNNIKSLRMQQSLTQAELAELSNLSEATVRKVENGQVTPSRNTIQALCKVLCPQNPSALGVTADDYTDQQLLLKQYVHCIPSCMFSPMSALLNIQKKDAVSFFFACLSAYLRTQTNLKNTHILLDAYAASLATTSLTDSLNELERFTKALLNHLNLLAGNQMVNADFAEEITCAKQKLANSRLSSDAAARLQTIHSIFFMLYDNWSIIQNLDVVYLIFSDITLLCSHAVDDHKTRTMTFSAAMGYFLTHPKREGE